MPVFIGLIRGINVGGHNMLKMEALRALCTSLGFKDTKTLLQSGNFVFRSDRKDKARLEKDLEAALKKNAGLDVRVMLRTPDEMRKVIERNPLNAADGKKLLVTFLEKEPQASAKKTLLDACSIAPDCVHLSGKELYVFYDAGFLDSKLSKIPMEKKLGVAGTARNWNTVTKLLEMAEAFS